MTLNSINRLLFGKPLDPFHQNTRQHIALITFFAWIGLGADGISSSCYGPEEAFLVLRTHGQMAIFLALATGITVFLIACAYLQVIELFPEGGGGYRVATVLLGSRAGLVSGSALIIDYILTIAISVASGVDALFSIIPPEWHMHKIPLEFLLVILLTYLNLRGMKESIRILMPIFLGFILIHIVLIVFGVTNHSSGVDDLLPNAIKETSEMAQTVGWFAILSLFFKAFSLGGGTYTGLEAVSNSLHSLAEPKAVTGRNTLIAVSFSLAFMATGIIMLYLLWDVDKVHGQTLNATAFAKITADWSVFDYNISSIVVGMAMLFSAGLLFVAANTGFLAGPAVLASMAVDRWIPHFFSALSSRLVTKNGILLMGIAAILALAITHGEVGLLVVLYSINVFLTFTLSLAGICRYRWRHRKHSNHLLKMIIPFLAMIVCASILITTILEKFLTGAWITIVVTGLLIALGSLTRRHYEHVQHCIEETEENLASVFSLENAKPGEVPLLDRTKPTAVLFIGETSASGLHTFLWVQREFPKVFHNFIFVSVGEIDTEEFVNEKKWVELRRDTKKLLKKYVEYCQCKGIPSTYYHGFSTDVVAKLTELTDVISQEFPYTTFFSTKIISKNENFFTQLLHNQTAYILQRRLHYKGKAMFIMPMKL